MRCKLVSREQKENRVTTNPRMGRLSYRKSNWREKKQKEKATKSVTI